jgi:hypothetical protein
MVRILASNQSSPGRVIIVDRYGNGDYDHIQDAIDYAQTQAPADNDQYMIYVCAGKYYETLHLYDYINVSGLSPDGSVAIIPTLAHAAIDNAANCWVSNLRVVSDYDPIMKTGVAAGGKVLYLTNIISDEYQSETDILQVASGTVIMKQCDLRYGGSLQVTAGTLKIYDSKLDHYHISGGAPTERTLTIDAGTTTEIVRTIIDNTSPAGEAVYFNGVPTSAKLLQCILRKSAAATHTIAAATAVSIMAARCLLNASVSSEVTIPALNDVNSGI